MGIAKYVISYFLGERGLLYRELVSVSRKTKIPMKHIITEILGRNTLSFDKHDISKIRAYLSAVEKMNINMAVF